MNKAITAAALLAAATLALTGCTPAASSQPDSSAAPATSAQASDQSSQAAPSPKSKVSQVPIESFLIGRWHCDSDTGADATFFGMDTNWSKAIKPDVEFERGVATQYDGPGKRGSFYRDDKWAYRNGVLLLGQSYVEMPETIPVPGTVKVKFGYVPTPADGPVEAETEVTFAPMTMTMKQATFLDGSPAHDAGQTVTCRQ